MAKTYKKRKTYRIESRLSVNTPGKAENMAFRDNEWRPYPNAWSVSRDWAQGFLFGMDGVYGGHYDFRIVDEATGEVLKEQIARSNVHLN